MQRLHSDGRRSLPLALADGLLVQSPFLLHETLETPRFYDWQPHSNSVYSPRRSCYAAGDPIYAPEYHEQVDHMAFQLQRLGLNGETILGYRAADQIVERNRYLRWLSDTVYDSRRPTTPLLQLPIYLKDLRGRILMLATDRNWSRRLQKKIDDGVDEEEIDILLSEIIDYVGLLMTNKSANFVIHSLVDVCGEQQVTQIIQQITGTDRCFIGICLDYYGTRVVQKLLRCITTPEQKSMVISALVPAVVDLINDSTGHRIIEICLETFSSSEIVVLYREIINNCYEIATDKCGCRMIQKFVNGAEGCYRDILVTVLARNALGLATDCYGNYVVQLLLGMGAPQVTANLIMQLCGNFAILSCDKYGSNVVETCLRESTDEEFENIVMELVNNRTSLVLLDRYGNYVIQSAVKFAKERRLWVVSGQLEGYIARYHQHMNSHFYGKKALTRLEKRKTQLHWFK